MKRLVHNIGKYLKILKVYFLLSIQKTSIYRTSFFLTTFSISMWLVSSFVWIYVIYIYTDSLGGYDVWQYIGFYGFYHGVISIFWLLFGGGLDRLATNIYEGKIDQMLIKPISSQFLASFNENDIANLANALFGFLILGFSVFKSGGIELSLGKIFIFLLFTCAFLLTFYSLYFMLQMSALFFGRISAVRNFFVSMMDDPAGIPTYLYKGALKFIFYFVFPVALVATIPTSALFFDVEWKWVLYYSFFSVGVFLLSRIAWEKGLRSYTSVSS